MLRTALTILIIFNINSAFGADLDDSYGVFGVEAIERALTDSLVAIDKIDKDSLPHNVKQHRVRKNLLALRTYMDLFPFALSACKEIKSNGDCKKKGDTWKSFRSLVDKGYQDELGPFKDIYDAHSSEILEEAFNSDTSDLNIRDSAVADQVKLEHYKKINKSIEKEIKTKRKTLLEWKKKYKNKAAAFAIYLDQHKALHHAGVKIKTKSRSKDDLTAKYWTDQGLFEIDFREISAGDFILEIMTTNLSEIHKKDLIKKTEEIGKKDKEQILDYHAAEEFHELRKRLRAIFSLISQSELKELSGLVDTSFLESEDFLLVDDLISRLGDFNDELNKYLRTNKGKKELLKKWHSTKNDNSGEKVGVRPWMKSKKLNQSLEAVESHLNGLSF